MHIIAGIAWSWLATVILLQLRPGRAGWLLVHMSTTTGRTTRLWIGSSSGTFAALEGRTPTMPPLLVVRARGVVVLGAALVACHPPDLESGDDSEVPTNDSPAEDSERPVDTPNRHPGGQLTRRFRAIAARGTHILGPAGRHVRPWLTGGPGPDGGCRLSRPSKPVAGHGFLTPPT